MTSRRAQTAKARANDSNHSRGRVFEKIKRLDSCIKYWEIIADNLIKAGWSWGCVSTVDSNGRTIFTADAHRDGQRFIVPADEKLTAFIELEAAIRAPE